METELTLPGLNQYSGRIYRFNQYSGRIYRFNQYSGRIYRFNQYSGDIYVDEVNEKKSRCTVNSI